METNLVKKTLILLSTTLLIWQINAHAESINWKLSNPETQNVDSNILQKLHQELKNGTHGYIDSFLVIRNNHLLFEEYYENDYNLLTKNRRAKQAEIMHV